MTTDSPWPISSNPEARYNDPGRPTATWASRSGSWCAPAPRRRSTSRRRSSRSIRTTRSKTFVFVDGGVTPYNNPAFLLYRFATEPAYRLDWPTGEDNLLLVSVGTGAAPTLGATADDPESNMLSTGRRHSGALMYGSLIDQDINCRAVGRCTFGEVIDREMLDHGPARRAR